MNSLEFAASRQNTRAGEASREGREEKQETTTERERVRMKHVARQEAKNMSPTKLPRPKKLFHDAEEAEMEVYQPARGGVGLTLAGTVSLL